MYVLLHSTTAGNNIIIYCMYMFKKLKYSNNGLLNEYQHPKQVLEYSCPSLIMLPAVINESFWVTVIKCEVEVFLNTKTLQKQESWVR